jgi:hypothetical protein
MTGIDEEWEAAMTALRDLQATPTLRRSGARQGNGRNHLFKM